MITMPLKRLATLIKGELIDGTTEIRGMSHDARRIEPGNLFCALAGARHDGHEFVGQAREAGAAAALVARKVDIDLPQLIVPDVQQAMGRIASVWREQCRATVIGVTGSNGKTTVKEMLAAILAAQGSTMATQGNYNNEIGVPLTLARLEPDQRFAVIEMGASRSGDIAYLAQLARPEIGIVTNAAAAHLEGFESLEGVARTKGEMFSSLPASGLAVINADDRYANLWHELASHCRTITFGLGSDALVNGRLADGRTYISTPVGKVEFVPHLPGRHNLYNALAATAVAVALGVPPADIAAALGKLRSLPGRLETFISEAGWCLIDDTYNANPASLYAGLQVLAERGGERWVVLGDMAELGSDSEKLHAEMGQAALDMGISRLFTIGELSRFSGSAFGTGASHFESHRALSQALEWELRAGVTCLVKGSRSMGMERVVQALTREMASC